MSEAVRQGYPALGPLEFQNRAGGDMAPVVRRLPGKMAPRDGRGVAHDDVASSRPNHLGRPDELRHDLPNGGGSRSTTASSGACVVSAPGAKFASVLVDWCGGGAC